VRDRRGLPDSVDAIESFARIASAWGAWLRNPANPATLKFRDHEINLEALLRQALLEGTNPSNPYTYWGDIAHLDQRIVESADIAVAIWMSRERVFNKMTKAEQEQIIAWLSQVDGKGTYTDNWILFTAMAQAVRYRLGFPSPLDDLDNRLMQINEFYRGDGKHVGLEQVVRRSEEVDYPVIDLGADYFRLEQVSDIIVEGQGMDVTTIRNFTNASADTEPFNFSGAFRFTIRDLTVSAGGAVRTTSDAIDFDEGNDSLVERVKIIASRGKGIIFDGKNAGWTSSGNVVRNCIITGTANDGIQFLGSSNNRVEGCTISNNAADGIEATK
jgi:parallel beta-helix repeat protein